MTTTTLTPTTSRKGLYIGLGVAAVLTLSLTALVLSGVFGAFTSSFTQNQTITAGTVDICGSGDTTCTANAASSVRLTEAVGNIAPNTTVTRYITLKNAGNLALSDVTLSASVVGGSTNMDATGQGLVRVTVKPCTAGYNEVTPACTTQGAAITNLSSATLANLTTARSLGATAQLAGGGSQGYIVEIAVGDQTNTNQGKTLTLSWVLSATQRAGNTTG